MTFIMIAYAVLLPTTLGFFVISTLHLKNSEQNMLGSIALGFGVGMGIVSYLMFIISWFNIPFNLTLISLIQAALIISFFIISKKSGLSKRRFYLSAGQPKNILADWKNSKGKVFIFFLLTIWLFLKLFFVLYENSIWPVHGWDSWTNWSSGAKYFFYEQGLNLNPENEYFFGKGYRTHKAYPLHIPLIQVWFSLCNGEPHEAYIKTWSAFYFIAIIGLIYSSVKSESNHLIALFAAFFLAGVPLLTYHATSAYADLPLSYYGLATTVCVWKYIRSSKANMGENYAILVLAGLLSGLCIWTKTEGIFFAIANTFILIIYLLFRKKSIKPYLAFITPLLTIALPWFIFIFIYGVKLGRGELLSSGRHFEILPIFLNEIIFSANHNIIFSFFLIMAFLNIKKILKSDLKYLITPIFLVLIQYLFVYVTTESHKFATNMMALARNVMTCIPSLYFISAILVISGLNITKTESDSSSSKDRQLGAL